MSTIIDIANEINLNRTARVRRAISNSGFARQERGSPSFYSLEVNLPLLNRSDYRLVEKELLDLEDGLAFVETKLSNNNKNEITNLQGVFTEETNKTANFKSKTNSTTIIIQGMEPNTSNQLLAGDFVQFSNSTKVYQVVKDVDSDIAGEMTIELNTPIISDPSPIADTLVAGEDVEFKFLLDGRPSINIVPGNDKTNLYTYQTFNFTEVL